MHTMFVRLVCMAYMAWIFKQAFSAWQEQANICQCLTCFDVYVACCLNVVCLLHILIGWGMHVSLLLTKYLMNFAAQPIAMLLQKYLRHGSLHLPHSSQDGFCFQRGSLFFCWNAQKQVTRAISTCQIFPPSQGNARLGVQLEAPCRLETCLCMMYGVMRWVSIIATTIIIIITLTII